MCQHRAVTSDELPAYSDLILPTVKAVAELGGSAKAREITGQVLTDLGATDGMLGKELLNPGPEQTQERTLELDRERLRNREKTPKPKPPQRGPAEGQWSLKMCQPRRSSRATVRKSGRTCCSRLSIGSARMRSRSCPVGAAYLRSATDESRGAGDECVDGIGTAPISPALSCSRRLCVLRWLRPLMPARDLTKTGPSPLVRSPRRYAGTLDQVRTEDRSCRQAVVVGLPRPFVTRMPMPL